MNAITQEELERGANAAPISAERDAEFIQIASHDLRAPLRAIMSLADWLGEDLQSAFGELPPGLAEDLEEIGQQGRRMGSLLDDLLEYSQTGAGADAQICDDVVGVLAKCAEVLPIPQGIVLRYDGPFPPVRCPGSELGIVLRNLIANAVQHHDRTEGLVTIAARQNASDVIIEIADDGPGLSSCDPARVFELFYKAGPKKGSGIGLGTVHRIVTARGGAVSVRAGHGGRGAVFSVRLPVPFHPAH